MRTGPLLHITLKAPVAPAAALEQERAGMQGSERAKEPWVAKCAKHGGSLTTHATLAPAAQPPPDGSEGWC